MGIWRIRHQEDGKSPLLQRLEQSFSASCSKQQRTWRFFNNQDASHTMGRNPWAEPLEAGTNNPHQNISRTTKIFVDTTNIFVVCSFP